VRFKTVVIARDLGAEVALASGLSAQDRIINNPAETLSEGDVVRIGGAATTGGQVPEKASGATE
jgi:hypothetical protein